MTHPEPVSGDTHDMAALRVTYLGDVLLESTVAADPLAQFRAWYADAAAVGIPQPNAMTVATASVDGEPSARTLLLKDVGPRGFVFYTNGVSRKGRDLADNPRASLVFPWLALHRQVVVIGEVEPVSRGESHSYAVSRPWGHRIGALASVQSSVIPSREWIDGRVRELEEQYPEGSDVPVPPTWGGYVVHPRTVEFWQGRPAGCTTGCGSAGPTPSGPSGSTIPPGGCSNDCRPEPWRGCSPT